MRKGKKEKMVEMYVSIKKVQHITVVKKQNVNIFWYSYKLIAHLQPLPQGVLLFQ